MRTPHYLSPLLTTRLPRHHSVFDCETRVTKRHGRLAHRWVCGAVSHCQLDDDGYWWAEWPTTFTTPRELWSEICDHHHKGQHLVVWAHNLPFDLRVSEALRWLPVEGYGLEAIVLEKTAAWAAFDGPRGKVTICDLHSWLPVSLDRLAADLGSPRGTFDYKTADDDELAMRCRGDVNVTAEAVGRVMEFLHREEAGSFRPTGSGQSHSMWRRQFLEAKEVLIHGDEHALERERTAMWAGRSEAWSWGEVQGPIHEHDLNLAYCRIAAEHPVPVKLVARMGRISVHRYRELAKIGAVLADVTVVTNREIVPTGEDGRIYWPVGEFTTTLWDPEVDLLLECGAAVQIERAWQYRTAPALAPMAQYLIRLLEDESGDVDAVTKRLLKHWARALVGRCALRYREWDDYGTVPTMGLSLSTMYDTDDGTVTSLLQVGKRVMELTNMAEADSSVPQITGWVMSKARANLWAIMCRAGLHNLHYVDTDCVIVNAHGHAALRSEPFDNPAMKLTHKATYSAAHIYGPRNIVLQGERRLSGVPVKATQTAPLTFDGEVWAGLRTSLETGRPNQVGVEPRTFDVDDTDPRRHHCVGGSTAPYRKDPSETTAVHG